MNPLRPFIGDRIFVKWASAGWWVADQSDFSYKVSIGIVKNQVGTLAGIGKITRVIAGPLCVIFVTDPKR